MALRICPLACEKDSRIKPAELSASYPLIRIGRDPSQCKITLPAQANGVSRVHVILEWKQNSAILRDQSTYGTLVNGENILKRECKINSGDILVVGEYKFKTEKMSVFDEFPTSQKSTAVRSPLPSQPIATNSVSQPRKRPVVENSGSQRVKQAKISSFFGGRTLNASALDEDVKALAEETPSRSFTSAKSVRSNTSVVEDSSRPQRTNIPNISTSAKSIPPLLCVTGNRNLEEEEKPLVDDTPEINQGRRPSISGNRSLVGDSLGSRVSISPVSDMTSQARIKPTFPSINMDFDKELPSTSTRRTPTFQLGKPKPLLTQKGISSPSPFSALLNMDLEKDECAANPITPFSSTRSQIGRPSLQIGRPSQRPVFSSISAGGVKQNTIMGEIIKEDVEFAVPKPVSKVMRSSRVTSSIGHPKTASRQTSSRSNEISDDEDPPLTAPLNLSGVNSQMRIPSPLCNSTQISASEAPTLRVNRLDKAFEAVSPKKKREREREIENTTPLDEDLLPKKRTRPPRTQSTTSDNPHPRVFKTTTATRPKKEVKIEDVKEEFDDLRSRLCSGKQIKEEEDLDDIDDEEKEKFRVRIERERRLIEEVRQNMDKMTSFIEMCRPVSQMNYTDNTSVLGTPDRPNFKKFKKAAQGRFNPNISSNSRLGIARIAGKDLVDFRKLQV